MSLPLRILCIADNVAYPELVQALHFNGAAPVCQQVTTTVALQSALPQSWDVVIAVVTPISIDPLVALNFVRAVSDVPFLAVVDSLSTAALALSKAGADNCLELHQLAQLPMAIAEAACARIKLAAQVQRQSDLDRLLPQAEIQIDFGLSLATAASAADAAPHLLQQLCQCFGWDVGEVWVASAQMLQPIAQWCEPAVADFAIPLTQSDAIVPSAIDTAALLDPIATRLELAAKVELQSVWSFPICSGLERLGVLILYSRQVQQPPLDLLKLMPLLTAQLGQLLKRQQSEMALQQLTAIVASTEDAIISTDLESRVLSWNAGAERLYGYTATEAIGQCLTQLIQPSSDASPPLEPMQPMSLDHCYVKHQRKTGEILDVFMTLSLIRDAQNHISSIAIVARDITDRKALDRLKDEFISIISHELRTPIAALQGSIELLLSGQLGDLSELGQRLLRIAARNSERLVRLTNDIFDLELFASGRIQLYPQPCQVTHLIKQVAIAMQPIATQAQIDLRVDLDLQPEEILADPARITQVLTNLLSNAIKFSQAGTQIRLTIEQRSAAAIPTSTPITLPAAESYVVIQVKDEGQGIPADQLETIFDHFQQADASNARQQGGAGLGLAVCRSIVRRHQGYLWVESALGQGSTFYLALPAAFIEQIGNTGENHRARSLRESVRGS